MEANTKSKLHPLTTIAAVSVTLFSLVGIGAITGLIPTSHSQNNQSQAAVTTAEPAKTLAAAEPATTTTVTTTTVSEAKPAAKPIVHKTAVKHVKPAEKLAAADQVPANAYPPAPVAQNYPPPNMAPPPNAAPPKPICRDCGVIESVREVEKTGQPSGSGAAIGGIAGGVLGNQAGRGNGRTVMTVLGAIGGAVAGHEIEKNTHKVKSYEIYVRFDDGTTRLITQDTPPVWRSGDRVRVQDGAITASNAY